MVQKTVWNWQQKDWAHFTYDLAAIADLEEEFLKKAGESFGIAKHFSSSEKRDITIQMISNEAFKTSEIEGEILDRESLQSSIKRYFGLKVPLIHETLWAWHYAM